MAAKKYRKYQPLELTPNRDPRFSRRIRRPFWLPALSFYILTIAIAIAIFFLVWGVLLEGGEEAPWIIAGMSASFVLGGAVFLREVILRNRRRRYLRAERQLDYNLNNVSPNAGFAHSSFKLGLKKNAAMIEKIKRKSEAARVLNQLPDGHWEVFELCNEYLSINKIQLETVGIGSPRLAGLRRGREIAEALHKYHLLNWVAIESKYLTKEAKNQIAIAEKIELSQRALLAIDSALEFYPDDETLTDSRIAVNEFVATIKISHWIERAERQTFKKNYQQAISLYRDALFYLARENFQTSEKELIADKIHTEIGKIRNLDHRNQERTGEIQQSGTRSEKEK